MTWEGPLGNGGAVAPGMTRVFLPLPTGFSERSSLLRWLLWVHSWDSVSSLFLSWMGCIAHKGRAPAEVECLLFRPAHPVPGTLADPEARGPGRQTCAPPAPTHHLCPPRPDSRNCMCARASHSRGESPRRDAYTADLMFLASPVSTGIAGSTSHAPGGACQAGLPAAFHGWGRGDMPFW